MKLIKIAKAFILALLQEDPWCNNCKYCEVDIDDPCKYCHRDDKWEPITKASHLLD